MVAISRWIQKISLGLLVTLMVAGGGRFNIAGAKIELGQVDPWLFPLFLLILTGQAHWAIEKTVKAIEGLVFKKRILWFSVGLVGMLTALHVLRHAGLSTQIWDVGSMHQGLYHLWGNAGGNGNLFQCDVCLGQSNLGEHLVFSTGLLAAVLWPFQKMFGNVDFLLFLIQSAILMFSLLVSMGGFSESNQKPQDRWLNLSLAGTVFLLVCFSQRWIRSVFFWDFREDILVFLFLSILLFALRSGKTVLYFSALFLALLSKESVSATGVMLGIGVCVDRTHFFQSFSKEKRWWIGGITFLMSLLYLLVATKILIPYFAGGVSQTAEHPILFRFREFGDTPAGILKNLVLHPWKLGPLLGARLLDASIYRYLFFLFAPVAVFLGSKALWKKSWPVIFPLGAGVLLNLIPEMQAHRSLQFHYELLFAPFLLLLVREGIAESLKKGGIKLAATGLLVALCFSGRWPGFYGQEYWPKNGVEDFRVSSFLRNLKNDSKRIVAANESWYAQLTHLDALRRIQKKPEWSQSLQPSEEEFASAEDEKNVLEIFKSEFYQQNEWGKSRTRGLALADADFWILDQRQGSEKRIAKILIQEGFEDRSGLWVPENLRQRVLIIVKRDRE